MGTCDTCGNEYDKTFEVHMFGDVYTFDSFECAAHKLAPKCNHCGIQILGHGVEVDNTIYCCAHCSDSSGRTGIRDRIELNATELA